MENKNQEQNSPNMRLDGLTALVTGAGRGLGEGCALALAESGAELILVSRTESEINLVKEKIESKGGKAKALACDVTDTNSIQDLIKDEERIDILMNNAGSNIPEPFIEVSEENLDFLININVKSMFIVAQACMKKMLQGGRGGSIIHMSSQMGHVGSPRRTVYCLTKHAVEGMSKAIAAEGASEGIRSNCIGPTFVETPMTKPMFENPEFNSFVTMIELEVE